MPACAEHGRQVRTTFEHVREKNWHRTSVEIFRLVTVELQPHKEVGHDEEDF
jgi:hypothetical protein